MTEFSHVNRLGSELLSNLRNGFNKILTEKNNEFSKFSVSRSVVPWKYVGHDIEIAPDFKLHVTDKFGSYTEKTEVVTVDYPEKIRKLEIKRSHYDRISHHADKIGPLSSSQLLSSDPGKFHVPDKFGSYFEKTGGVTEDYLSEKIRELEIDRSHYDRISHDADKIGPLSSSQLLSSDPGKFHVPDKFGSYFEKTGGVTEDYLSEKIRELEIDRSHYDRISHDADKIGPLSSSQLLSSDPGKCHVPDKFGYVSHYLGSNPGKFDFADVQLLRSDSAYKEATQNTGMSSGGGGKGKDGEPTKDDERTLAWKLRLSVEAVTPKFIASATINLEKKSG